MRISATAKRSISAETARAFGEGITSLVTGAFVIRRDRSFLLVRRSAAESFLPGYFELPGGCVGPDEAVSDALARELFEETGLRLDRVIALIETFDYFDNDGALKRQLNFVVTASEGCIRLNPNEHDYYEWAEFRGLEANRSFNMSNEVREIVAKARVLASRLNADLFS